MKIPDGEEYNDLTIFDDYLKGNIINPIEIIFYCIDKASSLLEHIDENDKGWDDETAKILSKLENKIINYKKELSKTDVHFNLPKNDKTRVKIFYLKLKEGIDKNNAEQSLVWFLAIANYFLKFLNTQDTKIKKKDMDIILTLSEELRKRCHNFISDVDIKDLQ